MAYKFLEHTADLKVSVSEASIEKAFISSANALGEAIREKIKIKENIKKEIKVEGRDYQSLLYNFLEEFLYLLDAEGFIFSNIEKIKIKQENVDKILLSCIVLGDKAGNYKFTNDVKAITYNDMLVKLRKNKVDIQFVLDV
jgi:SHS2 domain-containing protein